MTSILSPYHTGKQDGYFPPLVARKDLEAILKAAPNREAFWIAAARLLSDNDDRRTA